MTLLVGLIFYVYNVGTQVNRRLDAQNAADSTAVAGGTWMARSMNLVAYNNVTQARLLALVAVLDALPLAAEMTIAEATGPDRLCEALERWRTVGSAFTPYEKDNFYRHGLAELYRQMNPTQGNDTTTHLDLLEDIDDAFDHRNEKAMEDGYDVERATQWPNGALWQAIRALDELSVATAESAGVLAQVDAEEFGRANRAREAFIAPILPRFPGTRTTFDDFTPVLVDHIVEGWENPLGGNPQEVHEVRHSRLLERLASAQDVPWECRLIHVRGGAIPEYAYPHRMGPFARGMQFRDFWSEYTGDYAHQRVQTWGYTTYGPFEHAVRTVTWRLGLAGDHGGTIDTTRFAFHLRSLANVKLAYLLGLPSPQKVQYADRWITDYTEAQTFARDHALDVPSPIMTTRYYRVHVKSTADWNDRTHWMTTWDPSPPTETWAPKRYWSWQLQTPSPPPFDDVAAQPLFRWIEDRRGWRDVTAGNQWEAVGPSVWTRKWVSHPDFDRELGLPERYQRDENGAIVLGPDGEPVCIPYDVYHVEWRCFGGIEIREEIELTNPIAGASRADLPAPIRLDPVVDPGGDDYIQIRDANGEMLRAVRLPPYRMLGIVRVGDRAPFWSQRFTSINPLRALSGVAEAKLYNPASWDLWTQEWDVRLGPVTDWEMWVDALADGAADAGTVNSEAGRTVVDESALDATREFFEAMPPDLPEAFINH